MEEAASPLQEETEITEKDSECLAEPAVDSPASRRAARRLKRYSAATPAKTTTTDAADAARSSTLTAGANASAAKDGQSCQNEAAPVTPRLSDGCCDGDVSKGISPDVASDSGAADGLHSLDCSMVEFKKEEMAGMYYIASGCY